MSSFPRRSARLTPHFGQDQTQARSLSSNSVPTLPISQPSSTSTTSYPSPSNQSLNPPPPPPTPQQPNSLKIQSGFMPQQSHLNVPLPSPSANDLNPFFGRPKSQPNPYATQQMQNGYPHSHPQHYQQQSMEQASQIHPHQNSISQQHPQDMSNTGSMGQLQGDFLAEAAKRAQIACLMRDFGDVSI